VPGNLLSEDEEILPDPAPAVTNSSDIPASDDLPETSETDAGDLEELAEVQSDQTSLDADGLPQGWVVRLGAFADRANAEALEQRLLTADYKAYIRPVSGAENSLAGVYVGPLLTRDATLQLQQELARVMELEGVVEPFSADE
jgi:cell division septation protein DedD